MITKEEFDALEKRHNKLMLLVEEQQKIMDEITYGNIFRLLLDSLFFHKYEKARTKAWEYLMQGEDIIFGMMKNTKSVSDKINKMEVSLRRV